MKWLCALLILANIWIDPIYTRIGTVPPEQRVQALWRSYIFTDPAAADNFTGYIFSFGEREFLYFEEAKAKLTDTFLKCKFYFPDIYINEPIYYNVKWQVELCSGDGGIFCNKIVCPIEPAYQYTDSINGEQFLAITDYINPNGKVFPGTFIGIDKYKTYNIVQQIRNCIQSAPPNYLPTKINIWLCITHIGLDGSVKHSGEIKFTFTSKPTVEAVNESCNS